VARENEKIVKAHLIFCEGRDAQEFLIYCLNCWTDQGEKIFDDFQILNFGGIDELTKSLKVWQNQEGFEEVLSLSVVRDAENDAQKATRSVENSFKKAELPVPTAPCIRMNGLPATGYALFPDCNENPGNGTLEDLCLRILGHEAGGTLANADEAIDKCPHKFKRPHKNRLHTCFSLTDTFVSLQIGRAAKAGAFSFQGTEMDNLKKFLRAMRG